MPAEPAPSESGRSILRVILDRDAFRLAAVWVWTDLLTALGQPLRRLGLPIHGARQAAERKKTLLWYQKVTDILSRSSVRFLNYGYVDLEPGESLELQPEDESERYPLQLYHHVVSAVDVKGLDVLEVSSGHGGGASFIMRYLEPETMHGIDLNGKAVGYCARTYQSAGVSFSRADAEQLPFDEEAFDVVVNVEASHCYAHMDRFLREVVRVLRPGGHFLFADLREKEGARAVSPEFDHSLPRLPPVDVLDQQLVDAGLDVVRKQVITANVLRSADLDGERRMALIRKLAPRPFHRLARNFAVAEGSATRRALASGEWVYVSYALRNGVEKAP